ncbi:MAG: hypothetical protein IT175_04965 [Acidobacteria bacterium]|nr:hypothetical protein [Acidobacteriota bacterium]
MDAQMQSGRAARQSQWKVETIARAVATVIRYGLAAMFAVSAVAKLVSGEQFIDAMRGYGIVPIWAVDAVATIVVVGELVLAGWLASGVARRPALATSGAALVLLGALVAIAWLRGATGDCGCAPGIAGASIGLDTVLRNAAVAAIAFNAAAIERLPRALTFEQPFRGGDKW